jgi:phosphoesterase RecJ-like protein
MKFALEQLGKKVTVIKGDSAIPQAFMHFPGAHDIAEKNFFEVDLDEFDLFIAQDGGGIEMISTLQKVEFPGHLKVIVIDHHNSNKGYGHINLVDVSSPATAFTLRELFREWNIELTREIATNLFIGMYTDTGGFKYPKTDYRVLQAAADCARVAPDFSGAIFKLENNNSKELIRFHALMLNSIETFCNDSVAIASVSQEQLIKNNIPAVVARGDFVPNLLKSVVGWNIGLTMLETEPNRIKLSFRTRDAVAYDVSKIAVALGGGGHKGAAGAGMNMPLEEAKKAVVSKIKELYNL